VHVEVVSRGFDPWQELRNYQDQSLSAQQGKYGATAAFVGTMRDFNVNDQVLSMTLEHYPGMTEKYLTEIYRKAAQRWELLNGLIVHRVGELRPDDPIVLVAVWSAHRAEAFEACRFLMEELKSHAPFWKKEQLEDGTRWVGE